MSETSDSLGATGAPDPDEASDGSTLVDARGLRCPIPVIRLARAASALEPGDLVTVWSTDPAAVHDVPAWARMRGHTVLRSTTLDAEDGPPATDRAVSPVSTPETVSTTTAITVRLGA